MEQLPDAIKQEIIKLFEIALKPISGEAKKFGEPFRMGHFAQMANGPETRWEEMFWSVMFDSDYGEFTLNISSLHLSDPWDMVEVSIRTDFFSFKNKIPDDKLREINEILYSKEFLALQQKK